MAKPSLVVDPARESGTPVTSEIREAHDAEHHRVLKDDPSDADARLDIALDESFPTSDAPGHAAPGSSEPAASSGYDEKAEALILQRRKRKAAARSVAVIGLPIALAGGLIAIAGWRLWRYTDND